MEKETKDKNMYTDEKIKDIAKNLYNLLMAESNEKAKKIMDDKFKTTKSVVEVSTMLPYLLEEFDIEPRMFAIDECCMPFATQSEKGKMTIDNIINIKIALTEKITSMPKGKIRQMVEESEVKEKQ